MSLTRRYETKKSDFRIGVVERTQSAPDCLSSAKGPAVIVKAVPVTARKMAIGKTNGLKSGEPGSLSSNVIRKGTFPPL